MPDLEPSNAVDNSCCDEGFIDSQAPELRLETHAHAIGRFEGEVAYAVFFKQLEQVGLNLCEIMHLGVDDHRDFGNLVLLRCNALAERLAIDKVKCRKEKGGCVPRGFIL